MKLEERVGRYYYLRDYEVLGGKVKRIYNVFFQVLRVVDKHTAGFENVSGLQEDGAQDAECMTHVFMRYTENNHTYCYIGNTFADFNSHDLNSYEEFRELSEEEYKRMTHRMLGMYEEINDQSKQNNHETSTI